MLHLDHLTYAQPGFRLTADWSAAPGSLIAIMGPSGAGKSTLLSMIAGFLLPTEGRVLWDGKDLAKVPPGERSLTILFQDQNLFPHLTIAQNLGLGLRPDLRLSATQQHQVEDALRRVGLDGLGPRRPAQLSGGQASRAALARALLRARPILLLDEPFAALGPALRQEMLGLVTEVANETGALVLMVTHDPEDARELAGLTAFVAQGIVHPPVPTAALLDNPPPEVRAYLGSK